MKQKEQNRGKENRYVESDNITGETEKKIRRSVSFFLSLLLILEMVSGTGMFAEGNRVKAKEETPYAVYLDLSGSSTAEALASKGIYAYAYDDAAEAEAAEPVKLEKTEGQQEIWQLESDPEI